MTHSSLYHPLLPTHDEFNYLHFYSEIEFSWSGLLQFKQPPSLQALTAYHIATKIRVNRKHRHLTVKNLELPLSLVELIKYITQSCDDYIIHLTFLKKRYRTYLITYACIKNNLDKELTKDIINFMFPSFNIGYITRAFVHHMPQNDTVAEAFVKYFDSYIALNNLLIIAAFVGNKTIMEMCLKKGADDLVIAGRAAALRADDKTIAFIDNIWRDRVKYDYFTYRETAVSREYHNKRDDFYSVRTEYITRQSIIDGVEALCKRHNYLDLCMCRTLGDMYIPCWEWNSPSCFFYLNRLDRDDMNMCGLMVAIATAG